MKPQVNPSQPSPDGAKQVLKLYNALLVALAPLLLLKKAVKFRRRGHFHEWDWERWRPPSVAAQPSPHFVFVALSWGEVAILEKLTARLREARPDVRVTWAIRERAAQEMARQKFAHQTVVGMPFDFAAPVARWLEIVQPDILVVVEKFWWPNLVWGARLRGARVALVNGRSRGRDRARYKLMSRFQRWVLSAFDILCFESEEQIAGVQDVLPPGAIVRATGNVKFAFAAPSPPPDAPGLESWLASRGHVPLLIAGSTAPVDEDWALAAWQIVRRETPCALLLAPRRAMRSDEVARDCEARGLPVSRRSRWTANGEPRTCDLLLLDTLGELAWAYQAGVAVYVGGSVEGRGHNVIEPLAWGVPVGYGPMRGDFEAPQKACEAAGVGFRLHSPEELAAFWRRALSDDVWRQDVGARAARLLEEQQGALERTVEALLRVG